MHWFAGPKANINSGYWLLSDSPTCAFLADGELSSLFETRSVCEGIQSEKSSMAA